MNELGSFEVRVAYGGIPCTVNLRSRQSPEDIREKWIRFNCIENNGTSLLVPSLRAWEAEYCVVGYGDFAEYLLSPRQSPYGTSGQMIVDQDKAEQWANSNLDDEQLEAAATYAEYEGKLPSPEEIEDLFYGQYDCLNDFIVDYCEQEGYSIPDWLEFDEERSWRNINHQFVEYNGFYFKK